MGKDKKKKKRGWLMGILDANAERIANKRYVKESKKKTREMNDELITKVAQRKFEESGGTSPMTLSKIIYGGGDPSVKKYKKIKKAVRKDRKNKMGSDYVNRENFK